VDATPFKHAGKESGAGEDHVETLVKNGFNRYGSEVLISGLTGTEMPCEIFVGCVYYQRLRHMVSDKFQVRYPLRCLILTLSHLSQTRPHGLWFPYARTTVLSERKLDHCLTL
jgi:hypothetical protein